MLVATEHCGLGSVEAHRLPTEAGIHFRMRVRLSGSISPKHGALVAHLAHFIRERLFFYVRAFFFVKVGLDVFLGKSLNRALVELFQVPPFELSPLHGQGCLFLCGRELSFRTYFGL